MVHSQQLIRWSLGFILTALPVHSFQSIARQQHTRSSHSALQMGLDVVTYLRTEWISAALCTNQTPRSADVCLQLGVVDGRAINFLPRTVLELITSSMEPDGEVSLSIRRQLKQQQDRRNAVKVTYIDQRADDLSGTKDESVDVVISLQAAAIMAEKGLDWKKSVREAARVLKPGGRLLFVEQTEIEGESYLEYIEKLYSLDDDDAANLPVPIFEVGYDDVDLVITPHIAGVAVKAKEAGMTEKELAKKKADEEKERLADLALRAYERGSKKNRKAKNKKKGKNAGSAVS